MSTPSDTPTNQIPKRKKILFFHGFQLRYVALVVGSLLVLLLFGGLHAVFVARTSLSPEVYAEFRPVLVDSTWRLFVVGLMYIGVVTLASIFITHRIVGPAHRLEEEIEKLVDSEGAETIHIRDGDEFEGLVGAINKLVIRVRGKKE